MFSVPSLRCEGSEYLPSLCLVDASCSAYNVAATLCKLHFCIHSVSSALFLFYLAEILIVRARVSYNSVT
jgi:hypothetical protein